MSQKHHKISLLSEVEGLAMGSNGCGMAHDAASVGGALAALQGERPRSPDCRGGATYETPGAPKSRETVMTYDSQRHHQRAIAGHRLDGFVFMRNDVRGR